MKTIISLTLAFALFASIADAATPVTEHRNWNETYAVNTPTPTLDVSNIWGSVKIRAGKPGQISVAADELRYAASKEMFDRSLEMLRVVIEADSYGVLIDVGQRDERWQRNYSCDDCRVDIQFEISVPPGTTLRVGTVMDGLVDIDGITGVVTASNVNGPVKVNGIRNCESIESVNGSVDIGFVASPALDCNIETINGDITLDVPGDTSLDVTLDLFNGEVISELAAGPLDMAATIERTNENGHNQYRIEKLTGLRLGAGGPTYSISSINGDVRIQKNQ